MSEPNAPINAAVVAGQIARQLGVFLPMVPFYQAARDRCKRRDLDGQPIMIWDAESLAVFKMMFFRRKDLADVEQILRTQGDQLDRHWVREQLIAIYGERDPRVSEWGGLTRDVPQKSIPQGDVK